jgi:CRP-like cAMP-binding protein
VQVLLAALDDPDGFLRYKAVAALEHLRRDHPTLAIDAVVVERQVLAEASRAFGALTLYVNLFETGGVRPTCLLARALEEKRQRSMQRLFQLLALIHPPADSGAGAASLRSSDARQKSGGLEYLDNLLKGELRRRVMLLVDEMPTDERVRRGNVMYKTRSRDVEDTLAQLVHDDNQVISATAILLIEERQLWSLTDDLDHVLAQRDARDWYVFEAASWALAASRMPAERRRQLWQEPLPAVVLVDRLRQLPLFDFTSVDELFRIAALGAQVRHEAKRTIYERGVMPPNLQFLLDGSLEASGERGSSQIAPPAPLAFEEVLEGRPMRASIRTIEPAICLSITTEQFLTLLAENVELAEGIFRWLIEGHETLARRVRLHGDLSPEVQRKVAAGLQPVDRVVLLQESPLLASATGTQLLRLAAIALTMSFKAKQDLAPALRDHFFVVLSGTVSVTRAGQTAEAADVGDTLGMYQALSGKPVDATVTAVTDGTALRFSSRDVFDVLADETALLQAIFSGLLGAATATRPVPPQPIAVA